MVPQSLNPKEMLWSRPPNPLAPLGYPRRWWRTQRLKSEQRPRRGRHLL